MGIKCKSYKWINFSLKLMYKLYCEKGYYGDSCSTYCPAGNQHYTCDPSTGSKRCNAGIHSLIGIQYMGARSWFTDLIHSYIQRRGQKFTVNDRS